MLVVSLMMTRKNARILTNLLQRKMKQKCSENAIFNAMMMIMMSTRVQKRFWQKQDTWDTQDDDTRNFALSFFGFLALGEYDQPFFIITSGGLGGANDGQGAVSVDYFRSRFSTSDVV